MSDESLLTDKELSDKKQLAQAAQFLDAETAQLDAKTCAALTQARMKAAQPRRSRWLIVGGAGAGIALAASLTALVVMPQLGGDMGGDDLTADAATENAFAEIALTDDADVALADDLAFVAWLEENHDPS